MDTIQPAAFNQQTSAPSDAPPEEGARSEAPARAWDHPLFWLGAMGLLSMLTPYVPITSRVVALVGIGASTGLYVWFVVRLASTAARLFNTPTSRPSSLWQVLAWCAIAIALWALSEFVVTPRVLQVLAANEGRLPLPAPWDTLRIVNKTLRPLFLVAGATCGGVALSRLVRYPNMLGPLAGVAALIDIWGVLLGGIVIKLLTSPTSAPLAAKAMAPLPTLGGSAPGAGAGEGLSIASVGTGDFLFLGLFFGVLWAHRMEVRRVEHLITPLVTLALLSIALGLVGHLPGLLFIGLGAALPNLKYLRYTREENFALLYAAILVAFLTAGLYFAISSQLEEAPPGQGEARPELHGGS